jgi:hypothetical protein
MAYNASVIPLDLSSLNAVLFIPREIRKKGIGQLMNTANYGNMRILLALIFSFTSISV